MTIVVAAASPDGIVLAADSRTTFIDGQRHRIVTDSAEKIFDLDGRFAVATYGTAELSGLTINGVMSEFIASEIAGCPAVDDCANALSRFFTARFTAAFPGFKTTAGSWPLGFIVAGYDTAGVGHVYEVAILGSNPVERQIGTDRIGSLWRGQTDVVCRLIKGRDMVALGASGTLFEATVEADLAKLEYILIHPRTLSDAADFASFLVRTTIEMQRFSDGTPMEPGLIPGCGGEMQVLASTQGGTQWLKRRTTWSGARNRP